MSSSSAKAAEMTSYDAVCTMPFTQIHRRPKRQDYKLLQKEALDLGSKFDNITFAWSRDPATGEEYALLADCWVRRRYCLAGIMKLGEQVAKNTKLE